MSRTTLRVRAALDEHFALVVAALLVLLVVSSWLSYAGYYATPETRTERRVVSQWTTTGNFDHQATVSRENSLYARGRALTNQRVYFTSITPYLNGTFAFGYAASEAGNLSGRVDASLLVRSTEEVRTAEGREQIEYWRFSRDLGSERFAGLGPKDRANLAFASNLSNVQRRINEIEGDLSHRSGELNTSVVARVRLRGSVNGRPVEETLTYRLPLTLRDGVVRVGPSTAVERTRERTTVARVETPPGPLERYGGPIGAATAIGLLGTLTFARRRDYLPPSEEEHQTLEHERAKSEFEGWITAGDLPHGIRSQPRIEIDTLGGLVDLAIDTNSRVIRDRDTGNYYVIHGRFLYQYRPPSRASEPPSIVRNGMEPLVQNGGGKEGNA